MLKPLLTFSKHLLVSAVFVFPCGDANPLLLFALIADLGSSRVILLNNRKRVPPTPPAYPPLSSCWREASRGLQGPVVLLWSVPLPLVCLFNPTPLQRTKKGIIGAKALVSKPRDSWEGMKGHEYIIKQVTLSHGRFSNLTSSFSFPWLHSPPMQKSFCSSTNPSFSWKTYKRPWSQRFPRWKKNLRSFIMMSRYILVSPLHPNPASLSQYFFKTHIARKLTFTRLLTVRVNGYFLHFRYLKYVTWSCSLGIPWGFVRIADLKAFPRIWVRTVFQTISSDDLLAH